VWESSNCARPACRSEAGAGATMVGLRTGSTTSAGILFQAGTIGQDSSEVAAEAEVKVGVVAFYRK
jgi:hypothetical protein